jgi:Ricin-type beta-trefoil lectin domain
MKWRFTSVAALAVSLGAASLVGLTTTGASAAPVAVPPPPSGFSHIYNLDSLCLGISGGRGSGPAVQWNCLNHPDQKWQVKGVGLGLFHIVNENGTCLGATSTGAGARVVGARCSGNTLESWTYTWYDGYIEYINWGASEWDGERVVLGVAGGSIEPGAAVVIWPDTYAANQLWVGSY